MIRLFIACLYCRSSNLFSVFHILTKTDSLTIMNFLTFGIH